MLINLVFVIPSALLAKRIGWPPILIGVLTVVPLGLAMSAILIYKGLFVALDRTTNALPRS